MAAIDRFIQSVLKEEGDVMLDKQSREIGAVLKRRSGYLQSGRSVRISDGQLTFEHPVYERFLDMKTRPKSGRTRKGKRIHNRFTYGAFARIADRLMNGYTEEVTAQIREAAKYTTL